MTGERIGVKVLGTAQDGGFPHVGCYCAHCQSVREGGYKERLVSCMGLINPQTYSTFMLDATPHFARQLDLLYKAALTLKVDQPLPKGILLTHAHTGHYTGLYHLGKEGLNTKNLPVYCTTAMADFIRRNAPWRDLVSNGNIVICTANPGEEISLDKHITAIPHNVPHRNEYADTVGWVIRTPAKGLFYLPDIDGWEGFISELNRILREVDYAFLDGTFYTSHELTQFTGRAYADVPHPPINITLELFQQGILNRHQAQVFFTHFNHTNPILHPESGAQAYVESKGLKIAQEGQIFKL